MGRPRDLEARDRILTAAFDLIATPDTDASINAIVATAGVGKATVYRWWTSRTAVVLDALDHAQGDPPMREPSGEVWGDVRRILTDLAELMSGRTGALVRDLLAALLRQEEESPDIRERLLDGPRQALEKALAQGVDDGSIGTDVDVQAAADALFAPVWLGLLTGEDAEQLVERTISTARSGLDASAA